MTDRTVESLQRELLAVARGGKFAEAWREINGYAEVPNLRAEIGKLSRIRELRAQIRATDPNAALYYGWGGPGDDADPVITRRADDEARALADEDHLMGQDLESAAAIVAARRRMTNG
jgi:hypothetical protein